MIDYSSYKNEAFECAFEQDTAILTLREKAFNVNFETSALHSFLDCLNDIEMDDNVKGIVIIDPPEYHGVENVKSFIELLHDSKGSYQKEKGVTRYGNISKRLTLTLNDFSKPIIAGIEGQAPVDSFGYFMACDNVFATNDLSIEFPGLQLGVIPIGAVSFFLDREVGPRKTLDMFLSGKPIDAKKALELGMVNQVVEKGQLKQACLDKLQQYYSHPEPTIVMTKMLVKTRSYDLESFFERSIRLMWNAVLNK